jgi:hypothetical protein
LLLAGSILTAVMLFNKKNAGNSGKNEDGLIGWLGSKIRNAVKDSAAESTVESKIPSQLNEPQNGIRENIAKTAQDSAETGVLDEYSRMLAALHADIKSTFPEAKVTLRDLMYLARFIRMEGKTSGLGGAFHRGIKFVYGGRVADREAFNKFLEDFEKEHGVKEKYLIKNAAEDNPEAKDLRAVCENVWLSGTCVRVLESVIKRNVPSSDPAVPSVADLDPVYTKSLAENMEAVVISAKGNFPLLLEGITALGKSFAIKVAAALKNQPLAAVGMSPALTSYELIGGYHPSSEPYDLESSAAIL